MICKCENCAAALLFVPETGKLECSSCGSSFEISQYEEKAHTGEEMEVQIYSCTACGAQLAVNGVESSTFCSYCGQPTIVFDRVSSAKKPKYIIPFFFSKDRAVELIRQRISKGFFIPKEIKNFEIERVRGIYIPFWVYDVKYSDEQYLSGSVGSGKYEHTEFFYRRAETMFYEMTSDASQQLSDEASQRLEPFFMMDKKEFATGYMSGFYADCFDVDAEETWYTARDRCHELFDEEMTKSVYASYVTVEKSDPKVEMVNSDYVMFPAWFLTFRYKGVPYTIMVNGQTEKVVGAVPYNKAKMILTFLLIAVIASLCLFPIVNLLLHCKNEDILIYGNGSIVILGVCMWYKGISLIKQVKRSIALAKESSINYFVKNRQEGR